MAPETNEVPATSPSPGPVTLTLKEPIQFGTQRIEQFTIRKPKGKDFRGMPVEPNIGDLLDLAGRLAAQPKAVMDELGPEDLAEVLGVVGDFFPGGPGTGRTG